MKVGDFVKFRFTGEIYEGNISSVTRENHQGKYYDLYMIRVWNGMMLPCRKENIIK